MGRRDLEVNRLFERKEIFADMINGSFHEGRQVLRPEELERIPTKSGIVREEEDGARRAVARQGDIRMRARGKTYSVIFVHELQSEVDYAMPVRVLLYDALEYNRQIQELEKENKRKKRRKGSGEFLSGITREDRISPVINVVLYLGTDWDGKKSLHEMMDLDWEREDVKELLPYIPDYRINLIYAPNMEHPEHYRTCLQQIFHMLKYNQDKKRLFDYIQDHGEEIRRMDDVEMEAVLAILGEQKRLRRWMNEQRSKGKEERDSLCQAITDLILDGEARGEARGETKGEAMHLIRMVCRKLSKGKDPGRIAEELDEEPEEIHPICQAAGRFAPDYDVAVIYNALYG